MGEPDWRAELGGLLGAPEQGAERGTPLALQVQVRELLPRTAHRWNGPTTRAATPDSVGRLRLGVRPVVQSGERGWSRSGITWQSLPHVRNRLGLDPEQHRWACEFVAMHRAAVPAATGQDPDWLFLDDAVNPLLWAQLRQAAGPGVPLVAPGAGTVRLATAASLTLDAVREGDGIRLAPRLAVDGLVVPVGDAHPIGDHGVWALDGAAIVIAPFVAQVDPALLTRDPVTVPAAAADELRSRWIPDLQTRHSVTSSDGAVAVAPPPPPRLLLVVRDGQQPGTLSLAWRWERLRGRPAPDLAGVLPPSAVPASWWPDAAAGPGALPPDRVLDEDEAVDARFDVLPELATLSGVRIDRAPVSEPVLRTAEPVIEVRAAPAGRIDWFDLGVTVTVDGHEIPFGPLFAAIAAGRRRLRMVDGTFLSLAHPRLTALAALIEDAAELPEWASGFVVPRARAELWAEFEDLADASEPAAAWRSLVAAVRAPPSPVAPPAGLRATLRPYQVDGLAWLVFLYRHAIGGVLADDMGLGKTVQCLALVQHVVETVPGDRRRPFLVVAPTSVASNWVAESARFTPDLDVRLLWEADRHGARIADAVAGVDLVVTTYARLRLDAAAFTAVARGGGFAGVLLDEAQAVKNAASRTHAVVRDLGVPVTIAVTGTPLENSLTELHALLALTSPGLFPSSRRFREQYVRPIEGLRAGITEGVGAGSAPEVAAAHRAERLAHLRQRMRPFVLRRTKEQVAPELPPIEEQVLAVDLTPDHRALYDTFLQRERRKLFGLLPDLDRNRFIVLRSLTLLRLLALHAGLLGDEHDGVRSSKLDVLTEELLEALAEGRRALVFSQFPSFLKIVGQRLDAEGVPWSLLDGATRDRDAAIARFRSGDATVFLISLKAGGFGLNLTEADLVYLLDPWWNPAAESQAIDRAHRIGQRGRVTVRRLIAAGTIEEKVLSLQRRKRDLFDAVVDDGEPFSGSLTADDVRDLLA